MPTQLASVKGREEGTMTRTGHFILFVAGCTHWVGVVVLNVLLVALLSYR